MTNMIGVTTGGGAAGAEAAAALVPEVVPEAAGGERAPEKDARIPAIRDPEGCACRRNWLYYNLPGVKWPLYYRRAPRVYQMRGL